MSAARPGIGSWISSIAIEIAAAVIATRHHRSSQRQAIGAGKPITPSRPRLPTTCDKFAAGAAKQRANVTNGMALSGAIASTSGIGRSVSTSPAASQASVTIAARSRIRGER
jgi:hypothetical protein